MKRLSDRKFSILIVDDEEGIRHGLTNFFQREGFNVYASGDFEQAMAEAQKNPLDVAIIDIRLKNGKTGIDLLKELRRIEPDLIEIIITGFGSIDTAVTSMKEGASDYIVKPIDNRKLLDIVNRNLEIRLLKNENYYLKRELMNQYPTDIFITKDRELKNLINRADKVKNNPVTILISGESGTGKEVLARYIHFTSNRRERNFITINCAALSENLLLSELFGHEKGAFTGAIERKIGKFEIADKGTLFLDEIGDMSLDIQAKLLRVIEESSFERVGGTRRIIVDVRIIAATNKDLPKLIDEGRFREDLYYRINVVTFQLPPLRERKVDISLLIDHFIKKYNRRYNKEVQKFNDDALNSMRSYHWPGNVRELENIVNQAVLLCEGSAIVLQDLKIWGKEENISALDLSKVTSLKKTIRDIVETYEKQIIEHFLITNKYNKSRTAKNLSLTRKTLSGKIEKYGLMGR